MKRGDISATTFDEDERRLFKEMSGKLTKEQAELNTIINSAIAQHAVRRDADESTERFSGDKIGFSADISQIEPEPVYN